MNPNHTISSTIIILLITFLAITGCSTRMEAPVFSENNTLLYPAKNEKGFNASIILTDKKDKESIQNSEDKTVFTIDEKGYVFAIVGLENLIINDERKKVIHLDWIGDNSRSFYRKRIEVSSNDTSSYLISSIAIPPDRRVPGKYTLKVYYFRELIAEKIFTLLAKPIITPAHISLMNPTITLSGKTKKQDEKHTFYLKEKSKIKALVNFDNLNIFEGQEMKFSIQWIDTSGVAFYKKKITLNPADTLKSISSSISISPSKRPSGIYALHIYLFDQLIDSSRFELKIKPKVIHKKIKADLKLYSKSESKTRELIGQGNTFEIKEKGKVRAILNISDWGSQKNKKQTLRFKWVDPEGKTLFTKKIDIPSVKTESTFKSAISATPNKRKPGTYSLQVYFGKKLIAKKAFELQ